jgi:endoglucanase
VVQVDATHIPRWRGFNLQEMFGWGRRPRHFSESDFELMADWGFNFVRLPMSYWNWSDPKDWLTINDDPLKYIDQAIALGQQYGIHVNLNFHRIPGYCVTKADDEPMQLFNGPKDERQQALAAAAHHWKHFAKRYKGVPNARLSFDLLNEPPYTFADAKLTRALKARFPTYAGMFIAEHEYDDVVRALVAGIRQVDPDRLIFADGTNFGRKPVGGIADLGLVQSTRGYDPMALTHYQASWAADGPPYLTNRTVPTWPLLVRHGDFKDTMLGLTLGFGRWDRQRLRADLIEPWQKLEASGVRVHVGECGVYNRTPHDVALAWMRDTLSLWKQAKWGYALWEFRGGCGILDSNRSDVRYEDFRGHKLDREMLALLQEF